METYPSLPPDKMRERVFVMELLAGTPFEVSSESEETEFARIRDKLAQVAERNFPGQKLTIEGRKVGPDIAGNPYRYGKHKHFVEKMYVDGARLPAHTMKDVCDMYGLAMAPILAEDVVLSEFLGEQGLDVASNGKSALCNGARRKGIRVLPAFGDGIEICHVSPLWEPKK